MQLSVRDVDAHVFRAFKAKAVEKNINIGKAITVALKHWLDEVEKKRSFLELKPIDWGTKTENVSRRVDKELYA